MMDIKWKILFGKTLIWLAVEIMLNLVGMDDVADYSEFIFDRDAIIASVTNRACHQ